MANDKHKHVTEEYFNRIKSSETVFQGDSIKDYESFKHVGFKCNPRTAQFSVGEKTPEGERIVIEAE